MPVPRFRAGARRPQANHPAPEKGRFLRIATAVTGLLRFLQARPVMSHEDPGEIRFMADPSSDRRASPARRWKKQILIWFAVTLVFLLGILTMIRPSYQAVVTLLADPSAPERW